MNRAVPAPTVVAEARQLRRDLSASQGEALDSATRERFEGLGWADPRAGERHDAQEAAADAAAGGGRHGADFSQVRVHRDAAAQRAVAQARAVALTWGTHVYLGATVGASHDAVLAHELGHVRQQQAAGAERLQPRLIAHGSAADIARFLALAEPGMGEDLDVNPLTGVVSAVASLATPARSPAFANAMHRVMGDAVNNAEVQFGAEQPRVVGGAFPVPDDMTGPTEQTVDLGDIERTEAASPGHGLAFLAHEITENYEAHVAVAAGGAVAGTDRFPPAHAAAIQAESDVAEDTVGPGRRVASASTSDLLVFDYENYYFVSDLVGRSTAAGPDVAMRGGRQVARVNLFDSKIDGFANDDATLPATAPAITGPAAAALLATPTATARIEGFTDDRGTPSHNLALGRNRADAARAALVAAGVRAGRIHIVGRGATAFVAPNDTEAHRAQNRRVVIRIDRPRL